MTKPARLQPRPVPARLGTTVSVKWDMGTLDDWKKDFWVGVVYFSVSVPVWQGGLTTVR